MKQKVIGVITVALLLTTSVASATTSQGPGGGAQYTASTSDVVMFGDDVSRTHDTGFNDPFPWTQEAFMTSVPYNGRSISLGGNSTAIGQGGELFFPVSAPGDSPNGQGYMLGINTSKWLSGKPTVEFVQPIAGVSNSSPVYVPSTGIAYLTAGHELYAFNSQGQLSFTNGSILPDPTNLYSGSPVYQNQIVSYPLYVQASQQGTSNSDIWVSSQNGNLYAVNPSNLQDDQVVSLGDRLDASPALVDSTNGTSYIAVTAASNAKNKYPAGTLFLINPRTGAITATVSDPYGAISAVASPIGIAPGLIMWNDTQGNVLEAQVNNNGTITLLHKWPNIGGGLTSYSSESGYSETSHQFILPFTSTNASGVGGIGVVNTLTNQSFLLAGLQSTGSPEISNDNLYISAVTGGLQEIKLPITPTSFPMPMGLVGSAFSAGLISPSELKLNTSFGVTMPTLTNVMDFGSQKGLLLLVDAGAVYTFGSDYTSTSPASFSSTLTLNQGSGDLPANIVTTGNEQIAFDINLNGSGWVNDAGAVDVYNSSNSPQTKITVPTTTLDAMLKTAKSTYPSAWKSTQPNQVLIRAYAPSTNTFGYRFSGTNVNPTETWAQVAVNFPAPSSSSGTAPVNPPIGCTSVGNLSCSSALPGYTEWRFLSPGMLNTNEAQVFPSGQWFTGGTAYKLHPIPEQAITSVPAAQTTSYYTYQNNPDGKDTQTGHWLNNFTVEFVNGAGMGVDFGVKGEIKTVGDMLYQKRYISSWTPNWTQGTDTYSYACTSSSGNPTTCTGTRPDWTFAGYTPNDSQEYLYRNVGIDETTSATLRILKNVTDWWNPSTIHVTATGTFGSEDTPITPAGSSLSWMQPVWASYGAWIPSGSTNGTEFSQVPVTPGLNNTNANGYTPNSMLPGTPTDGTPANAPAPDTQHGVWYSDAPMPAPPNPSVVYSRPSTAPIGQPVSHPFDSQHNGGVIFEPNAAHSDYPQMGAGTWWVQPTYTITSGGQTFEHTHISMWIPTWGKQWFNNSGQGVVTSETSTVTWNH